MLIAEGLKGLGVEVTVVSPVEAEGFVSICVPHPQAEPSIGDHPPAGETIAARAKNVLRRQLLLPDPDIRWARRAAKAAIEQATGVYDGVITTSPPESIHVAGAKVAKHLQIKWLADFRDSWLEDPLLEVRRNKFRKSIERKLAQHWLRAADAVSAVSDVIVSELDDLFEQPVLLLPQMVRPSPQLKPIQNG